jgi:hypothetical protein
MPDQFDLSPQGATRLIADLSTIPQSPVGPHLDTETLSGLVTNSLSAAGETEALAHLVSCAACAEEAAHALHGVMSARRATDRAFLQVVAFVAVTIARRDAVARRRLATRGSEWKTMSPEGFSCALLERPAGVPVFAIRSAAPDCADVPLRCVIRDANSGESWAETWVVLHHEGTGPGVACEAAVRLPATLPFPDEWTAEVNRCEFNPGRSPTAAERESLQQAMKDASARDLAAWRQWLEQEVTGGRVSDSIRRVLLQN